MRIQRYASHRRSAESVEATTVTTAGPIINASPTMGVAGNGLLFALVTSSTSPPFQITRNGVLDTITGNVTELYYHNHTCYQVNTSNAWYLWNTTSNAWAVTTNPIPTGQFTVSGGQILDPTGAVWRGLGVAVYAASAASGGASLAQTIRSRFPGMNLLRLSFDDSALTDPTTHAAFVNDMTNNHVAVVFEDHNINETVLTSSTTPTLAAETAWYVSVVNAYPNNPYVLFQTMNEPNVGDGAQMQATYNGIRGAGCSRLIFFEAGFAAQGNLSGIDTSIFSTMTNVAWDYHAYVDPPNNWTVQQIVTRNNTTIANLNAVHSADGVMPVLLLEIGNQIVYATNNDPSGVAEITAAFQNPVGACAWIWHAGGGPTGIQDNLTNADTTLNSYGQQVAGLIAAG